MGRCNFHCYLAKTATQNIPLFPLFFPRSFFLFFPLPFALYFLFFPLYFFVYAALSLLAPTAARLFYWNHHLFSLSFPLTKRMIKTEQYVLAQVAIDIETISFIFAWISFNFHFCKLSSYFKFQREIHKKIDFSNHKWIFHRIITNMHLWK